MLASWQTHFMTSCLLSSLTVNVLSKCRLIYYTDIRLKICYVKIYDLNGVTCSHFDLTFLVALYSGSLVVAVVTHSYKIIVFHLQLVVFYMGPSTHYHTSRDPPL